MMGAVEGTVDKVVLVLVAVEAGIQAIGNSGGGSQSGGGGEGGGEGGGDGKDNSREDGDSKEDPSEDVEETEEEEEVGGGICFKSLEQLLAEVRAQSAREQNQLESYDDIPEVDDPVLFCSVCGLDEDVCVCPNSSLHRLITQDNLHNRPELEDDLPSSQQETLVLEYRKLLGEQQPTVSCYSDDLVSPRRDTIEAWNDHEDTASRQSDYDSSPAPSFDFMLATGMSITPAQRPSSVKWRPGSSRAVSPIQPLQEIKSSREQNGYGFGNCRYCQRQWLRKRIVRSPHACK